MDNIPSSDQLPMVTVPRDGLPKNIERNNTKKEYEEIDIGYYNEMIEFHSEHSLLETIVPTPEEDVRRQIELYEANEYSKWNAEERLGNEHLNQSLYMTNIIQFAIQPEEYLSLRPIAIKASMTSSPATLISQFVGVLGQYAVSKFLTGGDEAFWKNERAVENRTNRYDCGMDLPGCRVDVKSSHLKKKHRHLALLNYNLAVNPQYINDDTTYIQTLVSLLERPFYANVYITGWAIKDMFPTVGLQANTPKLKDHQCLYIYQLKPLAPLLYVDTHSSFLKNDKRLHIHPWRDFNNKEVIKAIM